MNRLWIRLSLSYSFVLLLVLSLPMLLFWFLFMHRASSPDMMFSSPRPDATVAGAMFFALFMTALFSAFVGIIAGIWVSLGLSKQVTQLVKATQEITPSNLDYRVKVKGVKELQDLAISFNRMLDELEFSQQARRNMLTDVSHELLTPMTVLEGNLRAMLDGMYEPNPEEISTLYDQTHHLIELLKDLRQLTLAEAHQLTLNLEKTVLNDLIAETVSLFEPLARDSMVELQQILFAGVPPVMIDRQRMRQVLSNLLSNAIRHTPPKGVITIQTRVEKGMVQLTVTDTGNGLGTAETAQIFDRFYRTDQSRRQDAGGMGLGLAIVKALVEAQGGSVAVESSLSQGTTFIILLPPV